MAADQEEAAEVADHVLDQVEEEAEVAWAVVVWEAVAVMVEDQAIMDQAIMDQVITDHIMDHIIIDHHIITTIVQDIITIIIMAVQDVVEVLQEQF